MHVIRNYQLEEVEDDDPDVDYELMSPARQFGSHTNQIPIQSSVQTARLFYGQRFENQKIPSINGEAPLVQNLDPEDPDGRSFDEIYGGSMGAIRARQGGKVVKVGEESIRVKYEDGTDDDVDFYRDFAFNQKGGATSRVLVKAGQNFTSGQMLAASNYVDDGGTIATGINARIGLVPYKGWSMDDALPVSESFAKRMTASNYKVIKQDKSDNLKTGLNHYRAMFPSRFEKEKLKNFDDEGLIKPGTVVQPGDPLILATMPRAVSSTGANIGRLSKALQQSRRDAATTWDADYPAKILAAVKTKNGFKVVTTYETPLKKGDKVVLRAGAKGTVSEVIPDARMPRTADGEPLDVLLNPLSLVSRANPSTMHELRLGKIARKLGRPLKLPSYLDKGQDWSEFIDQMEKENGVKSEEQIIDPDTGRPLDADVTVGYAYVNRLHHTASTKGSARGVGSYDVNQQPTRGSGEMAQAKRFSGLENAAAMSAGAYATLRENSTVRGQKNDDYWRAMRSGKSLPKPGTPFVWNKFRALLTGSGMRTRDEGKGQIRLGPFTDADLDEKDPVDIEEGTMIDLKTMQPLEGGLFSPRIVNGEKWGRIKLPAPIILPSMEESVRVMLGMTKSEMEAVMAGEADLPEKLIEKLSLR